MLSFGGVLRYNVNAWHGGEAMEMEDGGTEKNCFDAWAQNRFGVLYYMGKDYKNAFDWFLKSAEQGYGLAQRNLGDMYYNGEGVEQNYEKAFDWYLKAAERGDAHAQNTVGVMYSSGTGVEENHERAFERNIQCLLS